ncbi:MAG: HmuY family protein [bacterium]|nr:HmuY family protein [bacterium]
MTTTTNPKRHNKFLVVLLIFAAFVVGLLLGLTSCMPIDEAIAPFDRGGTQDIRISLGSNYSTALYYDLVSQTVVLQRPITSWHIAVSGDNADSLIYLNTALIMSATNLGAVAWESVTTPTTTLQQQRYDAPSGDPDSTAFGRWWKADGTSTGDVYLVSLGIDESAKDLGWRKMMPVGVDATGITIRIAMLDGTNDSTITIPRNPSYDHVALECTTKPLVVFYEPLRGTWDLLFTRYTYFFYAPDFLAYAVTGVLQSKDTRVALTDSIEFADVVASDTLRWPPSSKRDVIGYDWKSYDIAKGVYKTDTSKVFLVRDHSGFINKLRFLDFYDEGGSKGSPLFVLQRL